MCRHSVSSYWQTRLLTPIASGEGLLPPVRLADTLEETMRIDSAVCGHGVILAERYEGT